MLVFHLGSNLSGCCCYSPPGECWVCRRGWWRFIKTKRWKISVSFEDSCWALHVCFFCLFLETLHGYSGLQELQIWYCRCDAKALEDSLCQRIIVTRDENIVKTLDPEAAKGSRDALAKTVYSRLFDWWVCFNILRCICLLFLLKSSFMAIFHMFPLTLIWKMTFDLRLVNKINNSIGQDPNSKCLIGVLDIYGFESFKTNRCLIGTLWWLVACSVFCCQ
jgi:hypothetical protein